MTIWSVLVRLASEIASIATIIPCFTLPDIRRTSKPSGERPILAARFAIEEALDQPTALGGFTFDLSKAFNRIPCLPLKALFQAFVLCHLQRQTFGLKI